MKGRFVFDINKCVGCHACSVACHIQNDTSLDNNWREINSFNSFHHPDLVLFHHSLSCNHCEEAPCMHHCPALSYKRDANSNAVLHIEENCIGCKYCTWACPYDAPKFNPAKGIVEKCNFCYDRIKAEEKPACATNCPTGALEFSYDIEQVNNTTIGFPEQQINANIHFIPLRKEHPPEMMDQQLSHEELDELAKLNKEPRSKVELKKEWTLIYFTVLSAFLVGWQWSMFHFSFLISHFSFGVEIENRQSTIDNRQLVFLLFGVSGIIVSSLHLGRKWRAWRSVLNLRHSWLSREIFFYFGFIGLSMQQFFWQSTTFWVLAAVFGFFLLISIDRLYFMGLRGLSRYVHSSSTILTAVLVYGIISGSLIIIQTFLALKLLLYIIRKVQLHINHEDPRNIISAVRIILTLVSFYILHSEFDIFNLTLTTQNSQLSSFNSPLTTQSSAILIFNFSLLIVVLLAELVDRIEYYLELQIITPRISMYRLFKKMQNALILIIAASGLIACEKYNPMGTPEPGIVIYGLLNQKDSANYIRVGKIYQTQGNPPEYFQNYDSINIAFEDYEVYMEHYIDDELIEHIPLYLCSEKDKDSGLFCNHPYYQYKTTHRFTRDGYYRIMARNINTGAITWGQTSIMGRQEFLYTYKESRYYHAGPYHPENIDYPEPLLPNRIDIKIIRFLYLEYTETDTLYKYVDWAPALVDIPYVEGAVDTADFQFTQEYFQYLGSQIPVIENVRRKAIGVNHTLIVGDEELRLHMDINTAPPTSHYIPFYTNIHNGAGVFASRYYYNYFAKKLRPYTHDSLAYGRFTGHLNFADASGNWP